MDKTDKAFALAIIAFVIVAGGVTMIMLSEPINNQIEHDLDNLHLFGVEVEVPFGVTYSFPVDLFVDDTIYIKSTDYGYALNMTLIINGSIPFTVEDDQNIMILNSTSQEIDGCIITTLDLTIYMEKYLSSFTFFVESSGRKTLNLIPLEA